MSISELMKDRLKIIEINSSSEGELEEVEVDERRRNKWDCESILSTHSNIFNHPKLLPDPKVLYPSIRLLFDVQKLMYGIYYYRE